MFEGSLRLKTILVSNNFVISQIAEDSLAESTFYNCPNLKGGAGTEYDASKISGAYAVIDSQETPGYFTLKQ